MTREGSLTNTTPNADAADGSDERSRPVSDHETGRPSLAGRIVKRYRFAAHKLRWRFYGRDRLEAYVSGVLAERPLGWVFLLGVNNSGTTLFLNLMERHPELRCMQWEGQDYTNELPHPNKLGVARLWTRRLADFRWTEEDEAADPLRVRYDWSLRYPRGAGFLFEKSPPNLLRSRWLQRHFRPARFVATFRSPYAVCEGIRRRESFSIEDAAQHWATANRILLEDIEHLDRVITYTYEEFCDDPTGVLRRIADFLELRQPFSMEALGEVESHSAEGRTRGIANLNAQSVERLSADEIRTVNRIAGDVMRELGYDLL